jgi:type I restriction enzyme, R subunit
MPLTPEQRAREKIDALLTAAGWVLQDNANFNRNAAEGVAVREFRLPSGNYLLFVDGKAAGLDLRLPHQPPLHVEEEPAEAV